jgi:hypothetical protein
VVAVARRSVLIGGTVGAGLLLAGCTPDGPSSPAPTTAPPPDPLLAELADERRLVAAYDATIARYPALRARLAAVRTDHAAHAAALATALGPAATPSTTQSATPDTATPTPTPTQTVAATVGAALGALRAAERSAAAARGTVALTAPADRARLLAGISASEASHLAVLA